MIGITMPQPSHYVTDGTVTHWYKKEMSACRRYLPSTQAMRFLRAS
jgi:hypothetical protein